MKTAYTALDFWAPSMQAASNATSANIAMTLRMMEMAAIMNPFLHMRPQGLCGVAPAARKTAAKDA